VIQIEGHIDRIAVDTCATPFLEQAFPNFVAGKSSLLVLDTRDLRVLDQLCVEADKFLGDGSRRSQGPELVYDRKRGIDAMLERWWQPAFFPAAVVEARSAVAQVGRTAPAAKRRPLLQFRLDLFAAVLEFDQLHNFGSWSSLPDQCHARGLAAWVDLEGERLED
jgi:hypothetical protein